MADPAYIDEATGALTDGEAWVGIATTTLASDAASVTFTSTDDGQVGDWSQYMDLVLVCYTRTDRVDAWPFDTIKVYLNTDTTDANYASQLLRGDGSTASAIAYATNPIVGYTMAAGAASNEFGASVHHFFDINSGKYKSFTTRTANDSNGDGYTVLSAATWKSQAAVTDITFDPSYGNLVAGSRFDLFGVLPRMVA